MACSCNSKGAASGTPVTFKVALPGGKIKVYSSEPAAQNEAKRVAGAYMIPN